MSQFQIEVYEIETIKCKETTVTEGELQSYDSTIDMLIKKYKCKIYDFYEYKLSEMRTHSTEPKHIFIRIPIRSFVYKKNNKQYLIRLNQIKNRESFPMIQTQMYNNHGTMYIYEIDQNVTIEFIKGNANLIRCVSTVSSDKIIDENELTNKINQLVTYLDNV